MGRTALALLALASLLLSLFAITSPVLADKPEDEDKKVFVCKYVDTPGVDERLQTGQNPISVSVNAIDNEFEGDPAELIGREFADQQGASIVVAVDVGQDEDDVLLLCPAPRGPGGIVVDKAVTGTGASGTEDFAMGVTGQTAFGLSANDDPASFEIPVLNLQAMYTVSETVSAAQTTAGWTLTGIVCTSDVGGALNGPTFTVGYNETVTCVVTNNFTAPVVEPDTATIEVDKVVTGADADTTEKFTVSVTGQTDFELSADDDAEDFVVELDDSTYAVDETLTADQVAAGWTLTGIVCTNDEVVVDETDFSLAAGETVSCVITNAFEAPEEEPETGEIKVIKRLCTNIPSENPEDQNENTVCTGRENDFKDWTLDFEVFAGTDIEAQPLGTITVTLDLANGSQGQTTDDLGDILEAGETYTVCEIPVLHKPNSDDTVDLIAVPRPDLTTGGSNQSEHEGGPCIVVELTPGTNVVQFLDLVDEEDEPDTGTIVVDKVVTGSGASGTEDFAISVTGQTGFDLSANDPVKSFEIEIDDEDTYTVSEAISAGQTTAGWTLTGIVCTSDENGVLADAIGFTLEAGETVTCVVTNNFTAPVVSLVPTLVIDKMADTETITITGSAGALLATPSVVTWTLRYTLTNGPVTGVVITDPVPAGFTFLDALNGGFLDGNTVTWNLGTLTSSGSVSFRTTVNPTTVARALVTNTATIDSTETAPDTGQDGVTVSQSGTLGGTPTPTPTPSASPPAAATPTPVRTGTLTSTGVPNTATSADAAVTAAAALGALMLLSAGAFVSAIAGSGRRRR